MKLDALSLIPAGSERKPPLLFVHGSWHAMDCWQDYMLPFFYGRGYAVHAFSLRGHGRSEGRDKLAWTSMADYVDDLARIAASLPAPPILIGHSMGGDIVRRYLKNHPARAAVLITPIPVWGIARMVFRLFRRHPVKSFQCLASQDLYPIVSTPALVHEAFYSPGLAPEKIRNYFQRTVPESFLIFLELLWVTPAKFAKLPVPSLVIGAEQDRLFKPSQMQATARAYGSDLFMVPGTAHNVMLEDHWELAAKAMSDWMKKLF
ncbi:MAG: alpha/beta fold hydrolase [candidate division FCPU426 bacterium]